MLSCIGITSKALVASVFGGSNTLPCFRLFSSSSMSVCYQIHGKSKSKATYADIVVGFIYFASYTYFTSIYFPNMPNAGRCEGEEFAALAGIGIISSYLLLFISFYFATYKKPIKKGRGRARSALVEMKDEGIPTVGEARNKLSHGSSTALNGSVNSSEKASGVRAPRTRKA